MIHVAGCKPVHASVPRITRSLHASLRNYNAPTTTPGSTVTAQLVNTPLPKSAPSPTSGTQLGLNPSKVSLKSTVKPFTGASKPSVVDRIVENDKEKAKPNKKFSLVGFLLKTFFASAILYGGTMYAATKSEAVMDFVIDKQLPYYEEIIHLIENGTIEDLKGNWSAMTSSVENTKDKLGKLTNELEKKGENLYAKTKQRVHQTKSAITHTLPAEQLQKPVEIEPVHGTFEGLPLVAVNEKDAAFMDESLKKTIDSFNELISMIDARNIGAQKHTIMKKINENVFILAGKLDALNHSFNKELESKLKISETKLLAAYTQKELDLTRNMLDQYRVEKTQLEKVYKEKLLKEVESTQKAISQAAVNATLMVRIEQTKRFEAMIMEKIDQERDGRLKNLEALNSRIQELEHFALSMENSLLASYSKSAVQQALANVESLLFHANDKAPLQSFNSYLEKLESEANNTDDELLKVATAQLKQMLFNESNQSLLTTPQLLTAWEQLAPELRSASLLPPNAGLLGYVASLLFSKLLMRVKGVKPEGKDIESVIGRVELSLTHGDLDVAVEEVANLKGWTRRLADDWVKEGRKRLEAEFLFGVADAEAKILSL